jgi:Flp pilus assembly protein TadD
MKVSLVTIVLAAAMGCKPPPAPLPPAPPAPSKEQLEHAGREAAFNALYVQAFAKQKAGDHAGAIDHFRAAIAALPDEAKTAGVWNDLGWSLYSIGKVEEAVAAFTKAIALKPDFQIAKNNLAMMQKQLAEAAPAKKAGSH